MSLTQNRAQADLVDHRHRRVGLCVLFSNARSRDDGAAIFVGSSMLIEMLHEAGRRHDLIAEQRQIHLDLQRHFGRTRDLFGRIQASETSSNESFSTELTDCLAEAVQLAERLDRIIHEESSAVGDQSPLNE